MSICRLCFHSLVLFVCRTMLKERLQLTGRGVLVYQVCSDIKFVTKLKCCFYQNLNNLTVTVIISMECICLGLF